MGTLSFVIDPDAAIPLTGDQIVDKINNDTLSVIDRADSVDAAARPLEVDEVTATELADNAVENAAISDGAVDTDELAAGAITTAKLDDDSVTGARSRAAGVLTLTGQPIDTETVTVGATVYTFQDVLTDVDGNVLIGASASESLDNLIAAINLDAGAGTTYAASMTENGDVDAEAGVGDTMDVAAQNGGTPNNSTATTETLTNGSWGGATLSGGTNAKMVLGAAKDDLNAKGRREREYIKTNPKPGQHKITGTQRKANGDLEIEYDSTPVA